MLIWGAQSNMDQLAVNSLEQILIYQQTQPSLTSHRFWLLDFWELVILGVRYFSAFEATCSLQRHPLDANASKSATTCLTEKDYK